MKFTDILAAAAKSFAHDAIVKEAPVIVDKVEPLISELESKASDFIGHLLGLAVEPAITTTEVSIADAATAGVAKVEDEGSQKLGEAVASVQDAVTKAVAHILS